MTDATTDFQNALFKALLQDTQLNAALGGDQIFDRIPERANFPYLVLGRSTVSDWSTSTEDGETIVFFIHVWSKYTDRAQNHTLQNHVKRVLNQPVATLTSHVLINLRFQLAETRRDHASGHIHGVLRFRAVLEPLT